MERVNVIIIGGGVVGCAIAWELSRHIPDVFLLEQSPRVGMATSTRNSGVVHSGIYYPPEFLKASLCVEGNRLIKTFCEARGVPLRNCGKIVVASHESQIPELEKLAENGRNNGVPGLRLVGPERIRQREPHVRAVAALEVASTAIVSAEELVKAFARLASDQGASIVTNARVTRLEGKPDRIAVGVEFGNSVNGESITKETVEARCVINSAGLYADEVAMLLGNHAYKIYPVRGEYAEVIRSRADLVNGLVYPVPRHDRLSLGVHLTKTLWGTVLVGPTARYVTDKTDYEHDRLPLEEFFDDARAWLPDLRSEDLRLAYSGLRPKLVPPERHEMADFVITRDPTYPRAIHLVGIESPGLTSAPAIAKYVAPMVTELLE